MLFHFREGVKDGDKKTVFSVVKKYKRFFIKDFLRKRNIFSKINFKKYYSAQYVTNIRECDLFYFLKFKNYKL